MISTLQALSRKPTTWRVAEGAALLAAVVVHMVGASRLTVGGRFVGLDWIQYAGNSAAVQLGDWALYQPWRGPLPALLGSWATHLTGDLAVGLNLLSAVSTLAVLLLTWGVGRAWGGPVIGVLAAAAFAIHPLPQLFSMYSTPYALYMALCMAAVGATILALRRGLDWAAYAGVVLGLAMLADHRALLHAGLLAAAVGLVGGLDRSRLRRAGLCLVVGAFCATAVYGAGRAMVPIPLTSLAEQTATHRKAQAAGVARSGPDSDASQSTMADNISHSRKHSPKVIWGVAALALVGLASSFRGKRWSRVLPVAVPAVLGTVLVSVAVVLQSRYLLHLLPLWLVLAAAGAFAITRILGRRVWLRGLAAALILGALLVNWSASPKTERAVHVARHGLKGSNQPHYHPLWPWTRPAPRDGELGELLGKFERGEAGGQPLHNCSRLPLVFAMLPVPVNMSTVNADTVNYNPLARDRLGEINHGCSVACESGPSGESPVWLVAHSYGDQPCAADRRNRNWKLRASHSLGMHKRLFELPVVVEDAQAPPAEYVTVDLLEWVEAEPAPAVH